MSGGSPLNSGVTGYKLSVGINADSFASRARGGNLSTFWVGMCPVEPKTIHITWAKFLIEKHQKPIKMTRIY